MINYPTKFAIDDRVKITHGLYRGRVGIVKDYIPQTLNGLYEDAKNRKIERVAGVYKVRISPWRTVRAAEEDMDFCWARK